MAVHGSLKALLRENLQFTIGMAINDTYMPWIIRAVFSFLGKWTTAFIFASNKTKDYYSKYIPNNIPSYVVPATVDTAKFNPNVKLSSELKEKRVW